MGLFGGDSKSESSQSSAATQTQVGDPIALNLSKAKKSTVNLLDGGAIGKAFNFGGQALVLADRQFSRSTDLLGDQIKSSERLAGNQLKTSERLAGNQLKTSERLASRYLTETADAAGQVVRLADSGLGFARDALAVSERQGELVTGAVSDLAGSFQSFVSRENNPGERVNLYLIIGAASVAALFFLSK